MANLKSHGVLAATGVLLVAAALTAAYWWFYARGYVRSDDARLAAELVDMSPSLGGTLERVAAREGDAVSRGALLFALGRESLDAAHARAAAELQSARASLELARAQWEKARNGPRPLELEVAEEALARARSQQQLAAVEWERTRTLYDSSVVTEAERDRARAAWRTAVAEGGEAQRRLALLREGTRGEDLAAAKATVALAQARLAQAQASERLARIECDDAEVRAPFDGIVVRRWLDPGAQVAAGRPVLTLLNPATLHVAANVEEKDLRRVAVGDSVDISVDAYPDLVLGGTVSRVLRATQSEFSLIPSEGVSGTFIKVAQRVPIRIELGALPDAALAPGLSVEVRIHATGGQAAPGTSAADE